ncbi:MAG: hypothetical protein HOA57_03455 [Candidatus Magasanikbacteria bacterium]|jgi:hypothetical protein|nr:hypothetical protein [Candidatus Magasanikbacteria bacterium]MBT4314748.1 hypothetical protein [Candidatus Magasanikbacteria bacterium]MBT4547525.1 hypothetical protein [Candidatus Magasanikbacteria bacterium]MBT6819409.1 hypothetical protein [Candidatus Magasanikbacteria bacterium]
MEENMRREECGCCAGTGIVDCPGTFDKKCSGDTTCVTCGGELILDCSICSGQSSVVASGDAVFFTKIDQQIGEGVEVVAALGTGADAMTHTGLPDRVIH